MERRPLGRSGLALGPVVLGAMFRSDAPDAELVRLVREALDAGIDAVDVAPMYGFGRMERVVGAALRERPGSALVLTKVGMRWDGEHGEVLFEAEIDGRRRAVRRDSRPGSVRRDVEESLARLGRDVIDVAQLHHRDRHTPLAETMGELARLVAEGKLRGVGVSNLGADEILEARRALGSVPLACIQQDHSLLSRWTERDVLPLAREHGIGFLAYSPLAQGLLGGCTLERGVPADGRSGDPLFQPRNLRPIERVLREVAQPLARRHDLTLAQLAIAWVIAQPGVSAALVGARSSAQVHDAAAAARADVPHVELEELGAAFARLRLDPSAGRGWLQRARGRARRWAGRLRRALGGVSAPR